MGQKKKNASKMVRCSDCGFLCVLDRQDWTYISSDSFYRKEGYSVGCFSENPKAFIEPHCSIHFQPIQSEPLVSDDAGVQLTDPGGGLTGLFNSRGEEVTGQAVLAVINKPRKCDGFFPWKPGFSPKEHYEMLDRERWQNWQSDQEKSNQRYRIVELILVVMSILAALGIAIVQMRSQPVININTPIPNVTINQPKDNVTNVTLGQQPGQ